MRTRAPYGASNSRINGIAISALPSYLHAQITREGMRIGALDHSLHAVWSAFCHLLEPTRKKSRAMPQVLKQSAEVARMRSQNRAAQKQWNRSNERNWNWQRHDDQPGDQQKPSER